MRSSNFTADDVNLLDAVANILWSTIQLHRDFNRVVDTNQELRTRLGELA